MTDYLFDFFIACVLLFCFGLWLVQRKTVKWLIRQWVMLHHGWQFTKKYRGRIPWAFLPLGLWWITGDLPAWVMLVRFITVASLVTFYKLYRKRQKAHTPKQRGIVYIPIQKKEESDEPRKGQTDQARVEETSERESDPPLGTEAPPETVEAPSTDERQRPQSVFPRDRVRRIRKNEPGEIVD